MIKERGKEYFSKKTKKKSYKNNLVFFDWFVPISYQKLPLKNVYKKTPMYVQYITCVKKKNKTRMDTIIYTDPKLTAK